MIKLAIKDFFMRSLEGICVRIVGIFRDGFIDDGTGELLVELKGLPEIPENRSRIDLIGRLYDDRVEPIRISEIDFYKELRMRELALYYSRKILKRGFGPYGPLEEEVRRAKAFLFSILKEPLSRDEITEAAKEQGIQKLALRIALKRSIAEGDVIEIEPGVYYR